MLPSGAARWGTGERSERIRTYNFPQGRVTDHRIGLTLYKINAVMDGTLDEMIDALATAERAEQLRLPSSKSNKMKRDVIWKQKCINGIQRVKTEAVAGAAAVLRSGGLVAIPTETVYGLGADS